MEANDNRPWQSYHNRQLNGRGWTSYGESRAGSKRASNEDNYILAPLAHDRLLVAVADGLGGHNAGQVASRLACESLYDATRNGALDPTDHSDRSIVHALAAVVLDAHQRIAMWSKDIAAFEGMGCTLTAAIIAAHRAWYCHVGDSRLYQIGSTTCLQITQDHSVKSGLSGDGLSTERENDSRSGQLLTQALGIEEKHHRLNIRHDAIALRGDDALLLCTDGLHGCLPRQRLAAIVRGDSALDKRVHQLIEASLEAGSCDDITAVLVALAPD
ncbi:MAG: protein phosphatase 2C domain-containing protein [Halioglobus sp.]